MKRLGYRYHHSLVLLLILQHIDFFLSQAKVITTDSWFLCEDYSTVTVTQDKLKIGRPHSMKCKK